MGEYTSPPSVPGLFGDLQRKVADLSILVTTAVWHQLTLGSNWENWGAGYPKAEYCLDAFGFVRLRGLVKSKAGVTGSTPSANVATLPAGYTPPVTEMLVAWGFRGGACACRLDAQLGGVIMYVEDTRGTEGVSFTYLSLSNLAVSVK